MKNSNFTPRVIWHQDIMSDDYLEKFGDIYFKRDVLRYYSVTDICKYNDKFLMVLALDFHKNMIHFEDVTGKVTVHD